MANNQINCGLSSWQRPRCTWGRIAMFGTFTTIFGRLVGVWRGPMSTRTKAAPMCIMASHERCLAVPLIPQFAMDDGWRWSWRPGDSFDGVNKELQTGEPAAWKLNNWTFMDDQSVSWVERLVICDPNSARKIVICSQDQPLVLH